MVSTSFKVCLVFAIALGIAFVVIGGVIPLIIDGLIQTGVREGLVFKPKDQNERTSKYNDFTYSDNINYDYYLFNITNSIEAMATPNTKLIVQEVGPFQYTKKTVRYNVSFSSDNTEVRYSEWVYYVPKYTNGMDATKSIVTMPNMAWMGVIGQLGTEYGTLPPAIFDESDNNAVTNLYLKFYSQAMAQVAPFYLDATKPFLKGVTLFAVPFFLQTLAAASGFNLSDSTSANAFVGQFVAQASCSVTTCSAGYTCAASLSMAGTTSKCVLTASYDPSTGFAVFENHYPLDSTSVAALFNKAGRYNLLTGMIDWVNLLAGSFNISDVTTWPSSLTSTFTVPSDIPKVLAWISAITTNGTSINSVFRNLAGIGFANYFNIPDRSVWNNFAGWEDFGIYQFATGNIARLALQDPTKSSLKDFPFPEVSQLPQPPEPSSIPAAFGGSFQPAYGLAKKFLVDYQSPTALAYDALLGGLTADQMRYVFYLAREFVVRKLVLFNGGLFTKRSAHQLLFGYSALAPDPLLAQVGKSYNGFFGPNITSLEQAYALGVGAHIKFTGADSDSKLGAWKAYEGQTNLTGPDAFSGHCVAPPVAGAPRTAYPLSCQLWNTSEIITGSRDGTSMPPFLEGSTPPPMPVYVSDALRVVKFYYRNDVTYKNIAMRNYTIDALALLNASSNPDNAKYYMGHDPDLIVPLNRYLGGIDLFLSYPHFLGGSSAITDTFDARYIKPDYPKHQSYIFSEPLTGVSMKVHKRLMGGLKMSPRRLSAMIGSSVDQYDIYRNIWYNAASTVIYLPMFWAEEYGEITDSDASTFTTKIYDARKLGRAIQIAFVVFGGVSLVVLALFYYRKSKATSTTSV